MFPPMDEADWLLGSGAKCRPCFDPCEVTRSLITPVPTRTRHAEFVHRIKPGHPGGGQYHRTFRRNCSPTEPGSGAPANHRNTRLGTGAGNRGGLLGILGQGHSQGAAEGHVGGVATVDNPGCRIGQNSIGTQNLVQAGDEFPLPVHWPILREPAGQRPPERLHREPH